MNHKKEETSFVMKSHMDSKEAVSFLINRFPFVLELVENPEDFDLGAYYIYELFADYLLDHHTDEEFLIAACQFIDDLANSGDLLLMNLLGVSILESAAQDQALVDKLKSRICTKAREGL